MLNKNNLSIMTDERIKQTVSEINTRNSSMFQSSWAVASGHYYRSDLMSLHRPDPNGGLNAAQYMRKHDKDELRKRLSILKEWRMEMSDCKGNAPVVWTTSISFSFASRVLRKKQSGKI